MPPVPRLHDPVIRDIAEEVGDPPEVVQHNLAKFFRLDLRRYSAGEFGRPKENSR